MTTKPKILFLGKPECRYAPRIVASLQEKGFEVSAVLSAQRNQALPVEITTWSGDYILSFRSYFVLPSSVLTQAAQAAINVHPAPPEYPGNGCINWALYDDAKIYGVTAHIMERKIDSGAIIECRRFPIYPRDHVGSLLDRTHHEAFDLIISLIDGLVREGRAYLDRKISDSTHEKWHGEARKMSEIDKLQHIEPTCTKDELERIIRATYTPEFPPEIHLHGYRFVLKLDDTKDPR